MHHRLIVGVLAAALALPAPVRAGNDFIGVPVTQPKPVTLGGDLYMPRGSGPHPAVILLHGCSGIGPNVPAWATWLQAEGYAALALDSFTARGLRNICADGQILGGNLRAGDVFAAVDRLKTVAGVDSSRIAAMGLSHGGWTVMAAWRASGVHAVQAPKAMIALYPGGCSGIGASPAPPLLILIGAKDDWTPAEPCQGVALMAKAAGQPVSIVVYPDAHHGFDAAHLKSRVYIPVARGGRGATVQYDPAAHADAEKQVRRFLAEHLKP